MSILVIAIIILVICLIISSVYTIKEKKSNISRNMTKDELERFQMWLFLQKQREEQNWKDKGEEDNA